VRAAWTPLFDQFDVDLVIDGHNHVYERTDPLRGGSVTTAAPIGSTVRSKTNGTTYALLAVDVKPGRHGRPAQLVLRAVNEYGAEVDKLTIER